MMTALIEQRLGSRMVREVHRSRLWAVARRLSSLRYDIGAVLLQRAPIGLFVH
jgi:hypothetical protein